MINTPSTSRLLQALKWLQPSHFSCLSPCLGRVQQTIDSDSLGVNVILTTFEIYDEERGCHNVEYLNTLSRVLSKHYLLLSVFKQCQIAGRRKTHSARQDHQTKRCHHHCFRINNFPIKIQIKFTPPTHFCFMVVSTHCRLWIHPRLQFSAWIKIISPLQTGRVWDRLRAIFSPYWDNQEGIWRRERRKCQNSPWRGTSLDEDEKSIQMVKNTQIIQSEHILLPCLARDRFWRILN